MIGSRILDLLDLSGIRANCLKHATHAAHEAYLLLEDLHAVPLCQRLLLLFVLIVLLLAENFLDVLGQFNRFLGSKCVSTALFHEMLHHVANFLHEERHRPLEEVHTLR